mmetsp:Transcript_41303/g.54291  ORF Transcript_41303/g.54291 Transcript_41303/m.54291 type:complete len:190 (-) Transcript_41303:303-872(-)|eukprot:CAMPEP_0117746298 /NCGR_PEP_ID=MMETSP0947-20121206/7866_1 /TAXON_ID=44440 /ORGANISM="Chattonella subsalsa, Strain CCMP2191" /LENGTH=189 /DNA_ID=CAMNT_0005563601 /DNA_START=65 /DNA_END=634 /DNA_ORIENTATION=+
MPLNPEVLDFVAGISFQPGVPVVVGNEQFLLMRTRIHFRVDIPGSRYSANGKMLLTTDRLIFVADRPPLQNGISFQGYDIPLACVFEEKFNQPIFGANNITGKISEPAGMEAMEVGFKISFNNGGCMTFLQNFFTVLQHARNTVQNASAVPSAPIDPSVSDVPYATVVSVDSSDPSMVFVQAYPIQQYG